MPDMIRTEYLKVRKRRNRTTKKLEEHAYCNQIFREIMCSGELEWIDSNPLKNEIHQCKKCGQKFFGNIVYPFLIEGSETNLTPDEEMLIRKSRK